MKTFYILSIFSLFLILSCDKEENNPSSSGDLVTYNVYLDLQRSDGTSFNEGEVEAKGAYINGEGEIVYNGDWRQLPIDMDYNNSFDKNVFGPFEIGVSSGGGSNVPEPGTEWVSNTLLLLRYQDIREIDTLRSRDSSRYPEFRYFDIYKNDELIKRLNDMEAPWKITIQK